MNTLFEKKCKFWKKAMAAFKLALDEPFNQFMIDATIKRFDIAMN